MECPQFGTHDGSVFNLSLLTQEEQPLMKILPPARPEKELVTTMEECGKSPVFAS